MPRKYETRDQLIAERDRLRQEVDEIHRNEAELQHLKDALKSREREVEALLGLAPHPVIARFDRQLRHTYVHVAVQLETGIPADAYLGKTSREMGLPDSILPLWESSLRAVFENGQEKTIEYGVTVGARSWFYVTRIVPELNAKGSVDSLITITRSVSEQRKAEKELLERTEILETVRELSLILSAELDLQKLVQDVTDAATEVSRAEFGSFFYNVLDERGESYTLYTLSGVSREAFSKFPMPRNTDLFGPTFRGEGTVRIDDVHQDPRYGKNDPHYGMPKGHLPVTSYLAVPVISHSGEVLGGLFFGHSQPGIFTERDERIVEGIAAQTAIALDNARLYSEAREQKERWQITLASIGDAVIATDARGNISFMNNVAQELTGWSDADARGKPLEQVFRIVNEFSRESVENPIAKVIQEGKAVGLANHTILLARNGNEIPIDDSGAPIRNPDGALMGVILVFRDITERKQTEQRINLLLELSADFSKALTAQQVGEVMVEKARKALGATIGTVALLVEQGTELELLNLHGLSQASINQYQRTPLDFVGPLSEAVRSDHLVWIESQKEYVTRFPHFKAVIEQNGSHSTICIPLRLNDRVIGGFNLSFPFEKLRNPDEETFFATLANLCAQSLERARLYEEENQARMLAESLRDTGVALNSALELSDVLERILNNLDRIVPHDLADIMLYDNGIAQIVRSRGYTTQGIVRAEHEMQSLSVKVADAYYFAWAAEHKSTRIVQDAWLDPHWVKLQEHDLIRSNIIAPILINGNLAGFLNVNSLQPNFYTAKHGEILQMFANQAAIAIENAQLHQRAIQAAAVGERQRLARELHDSVTQSLFSATVIATSLPRLFQDNPDRALEQLGQLQEMAQGANAEMRTMLLELRPENVIKISLSDLFHQLSNAAQARQRIAISILTQGDDLPPLPEAVHFALYRIAQESLNNIIHHGDATQVRLRLNRTADNVELVVVDNGTGFDVNQVHSGFGLTSMRERAESIQADLRIQSKSGIGTRVKAVWKSSQEQM